MSAPNNFIISVDDWNVKALRMYPSKPGAKGGKTVNFTSTQTGKALHIHLPNMTHYGISDYVNPTTGEHDGKFKLSCKVSSKELVDKLWAFQDLLIKEAVANSMNWFGKTLNEDVAKFNLKFPLEYPHMSKTDKTPDTTKDPYLKINVPNYSDSGWDFEIYNEDRVLLFPSDKYSDPIDLMASGSKAAYLIKCNSIWIVDGKWGVSFKLIQCVITPEEKFIVRNRCLIPTNSNNVPQSHSDSDETEPETVKAPEPEPKPVKAPEPEPEPVEAPEPVKKTVGKKIIKK